MSFRLLYLLVLGLLAMTLAEPLLADSCATPLSDVVLQSGVSTIGLSPSNLNTDQANALGSAITEWNGCSASGSSPSFLLGSNGNINVSVRFYDRQATFSDCQGTTSCACFAWQTTFDSSIGKHRITGGEVKIFDSSPSGNSCNVSAAGGRLNHVMAHELGHVLGLADTTDSGSCGGRPMLQGSSSHTGVAPGDCEGAQEAQTLSNEPPPSTDPDGDILNQDCEGGGCSPILLDLDQRNFKLTHWAEGVLFDIDADGFREAIGWTAPDSQDGFLVLDRNGNGTVDAGNELFGNFSPQPPSESPNGYLALAVFDGFAEGGNLDGQISFEDAIFPRLRLWIDRNHDGVSDPGELEPLTAHCVETISVQYFTAQGRDAHGNELRHFSPVRLCSGMTRSVDVFFVTGDPSDE